MAVRRPLALGALVLALAPFIPVRAFAQVTGFQEYFVPVREEQLQNVYDDMNGSCDEFMHAVITVTAGSDGTRIYWDHWETSGYNFDVNNPGATADESYVLNAGESQVFESASIPTNPRGILPYYDGADRIFSSGRVTTVTKAGWCENVGTVAAYAWEVYPVAAQNTSYVIPVGEDYSAGTKDYLDFQRVYVMVMSLEDNNVVTINDPNSGGTEYSDADMDRGEVNIALLRTRGPARVTGTKKVQAVFFGGQHPTTYNRRTLNVPPLALFGSDYVSPVPGFGGGRDTDLFIYNGNGFAIDVDATDDVGTGVITVPAGDTIRYSDVMGRFVPADSPVRLTNLNGDPFWAFGVGDTEATSYDWTFNLVQVPLLQETNNIGWAPGSRTPGPGSNGSPLYVSPADDGTYVFIDFSPIDGVDDQVFQLNRGDTIKVYDPDGDNTGTRILSIGKVAVTFGEDPSVAGAGNPFLDLGYSHPPFLETWVDPVLDIAHTGFPTTLPASGGTTTVTLSATTFGVHTIDGVDLQDLLAPGWAYVPGSTVVTLPGGSPAPAADPSIVGDLLTWDTSVNMPVSATLTLQFQAQTTGSTSFGVNRFVGRAVGSRGAGADLMTFSPEENLFITITPPPTVVKTLYLRPDGTDAGTVRDLDRNMPTGGSSTVLAVADGTTATWELSPPLAQTLGIPSTLTARLFLDPVTGTLPPDVTVRLLSGTTLLGLATLNDLNSAVQQYDFAITPFAASLAAGQTIVLEVSVSGAGGGGRVDVYFDSAANRSRIDIPTFSYIRVNSVSTFSAAYPGGVPKTVFQQGETVSVRAVVSDPFGFYDITDTDSDLKRGGISIATPSPAVVTSGGASITFQVLRADTIPGSYTLDVTAFEGTEGTVTHTAQGAWTVVDDDRDDDGVTNLNEAALGTNPDLADTDGDGLQDGTEIGLAAPQGLGTDLGVFVPDADPLSTTNPLDPDTDNDLLLDGIEDTDHDGDFEPAFPDLETDPNDADTDGDLILDGTEDSDLDGIWDPGIETDANVADTDLDGITDGVEDADRDGVLDANETDPRIADTDGDGLDDGVEDFDKDGTVDAGETNPLDDDTDDDGLLDGNEDANGDRVVGAAETNPLLADTDADFLEDGLELGLIAPQGAGTVGFVADADAATTTDPRDDDSDDDGLLDGNEDANHDGEVGAAETDPNSADSDADFLNDGLELGLVAAQGVNTVGFVADADPATTTSPLDDDHDDDGLLDGNEDLNRNGAIAGTETDNRDFDSDDDLLSDGLELGLANPQGSGTVLVLFDADTDPLTTTDPLDDDSDEDGLLDGNEDVNQNGAVGAGESDPELFDTDGDFLSDGLESGLVAPQGTDTVFLTFDPDTHPGSTTNPADDDTDDDGLLDGSEDLDGDGFKDATETDPNVFDTDLDGLGDGMESGLTAPQGQDTAAPPFVADGDSLTTTDPLDADSDDDLVLDGTEDLDRDGVDDLTEWNPNAPDTDNDGLTDGEEDANHDGIRQGGETDPLDADTDNDNLADGTEIDGTNPTNPFDDDSDDDGILDGNEDTNQDGALAAGESNPNAFDTDGDALSDGKEIGLLAPQGLNTVLATFQPDTPASGTTSPTDDDTDDDGLMDGNEDADRDGFRDPNETDPNDFDTDNDFLGDGMELGLVAAQGDDTGPAFVADSNPATQTLPLDDDTDDDGLLDGNEDANRNGNREANETRAQVFDTDLDGLGDGQELGLTAPQGSGTDLADFIADTDGASTTLPLDDDSDDDGRLDGNEDSDHDGFVDPTETDPNVFDTDGDGLGDGLELGLTAPQGTGTGPAFVADSQGTSTTNPLDDDSDDDGRTDGNEDADGDGFKDANETNPNAFDTDGDGLSDGLEIGLVAPQGSDTDLGLFDADADPATQTDPLDTDTDDDLLTDGVEDANGDGARVATETDPLDDDSDDDGRLDGTEDADDDHVLDAGETNPLSFDTDGDGLSDGLEVGLLAPEGLDTSFAVFDPDTDGTTTTNPRDADTDDDGRRDGSEDADSDGFVDATETDPNVPDTDGDGIEDGVEVGLTVAEGGADSAGFVADADPASTTDPLDDDSDDDGLLDGTEDANANGAVAANESDPNALDSDADGLQDGLEAGLIAPEGNDTVLATFLADTDPATTTNPADDDTDDDGLLDGSEDTDADGFVDGTETDPNEPDTDSDGVQDGTELGLTAPEGSDTGAGFVPDADAGTETTDPLDADSDDDLLLDGTEDADGDGEYDVGLETDPNVPDTDGDLIGDGVEDANHDGDVDAGETDPRIADSDNDGLADGVELGGPVFTNPNDDDSDDDGILDGNEDLNRNGTLDPGETSAADDDSDGDGIADGIELGLTVPQGNDTNGGLFVADADPATTTDPTDADSDGDGLSDGVEDANKNGAVGSTETDPGDDDTDDDLVHDGAEVLGVLGTSALDDDSDDDGILDGNEDLDRDGAPDAGESDPTNGDTDGDGLPDGVEAGLTAPEGNDTGAGFVADADGDSQTSFLDDDSDDDGLIDGNEDADADGMTAAGETAPDVPDSDLDGVDDGIEIGLTAPQGLGTLGFLADADPATTTDALDDDSDDDGLLDGTEDGDGNGAVAATESDPLSPDSDADGILDGTEAGLSLPQGAGTNGNSFMADADPSTTTGVADDDSDDDGILDGNEDLDRNGASIATELDPLSPDSDGDQLQDGLETGLTAPQGSDTDLTLFRADADGPTTTDPFDDDSDDDGLIDGAEDADHNGVRGASETEPTLFDSDADGLGDGLELGLTTPQGQDTNPAAFVADANPDTQTDPLNADTDSGGMSDGREDVDKNGRRDRLERNPLDGRDDTDPIAAGSGCSCSLDAGSGAGGRGAPMGSLFLATGAFALAWTRRRRGALSASAVVK